MDAYFLYTHIFLLIFFRNLRAIVQCTSSASTAHFVLLGLLPLPLLSPPPLALPLLVECSV